MSTDDRKDLPPVTSKNFLEKVREALSVYMGNRGDLLDRGITARDLVDAGIISLRPGWLTNGGRNPINGPGTRLEPAYDIDLTPPPTPTGFTATAAISNLMVQCDPQLYKAGHGHANSVLYGASWVSGPLPVFTDSVVLEEFSGTVRSHATNPATTWHLWLKWVTVDGVESTTPAGGTNGVVTRTGEDVALLLTALTGQITESELYGTLGSRIDLIDGGVAQPALPYPLVKIAALQDGLNQQARLDLNSAAESILQTAITANNTLQTVHDAGININPATGLVEIYGLELAKDHLNTVDIRLNAAEGSLLLKATTVYVDGAIASATLTPADLLLFNSMSARVSSAEVRLNSLEGTIVLKASVVDLTATTARVTTSETNIDALNGQMALRVTSADYTARTNALDARLGSAEIVLSSIGDVSAITSMVTQSNKQDRVSNEDATTLLRTLLSGEAAATQTRDELAVARTDITATVIAGVSAEAAQRLELAALVNGNLATLTLEQTALSDDIHAETEQRLLLQAAVNDPLTGLSTKAASSYVDSAKADAISASAASIAIQQARLDPGGEYAAVKVESAASASAVTGLNAQYTVKLQVGTNYVTGYGLASSSVNGVPTSEFIIRADNFAIAPVDTDNAAADGSPFFYRTTATVINGVSVPPGAYMKAAYIHDATITNAKIANAAIDDAKIANLSATKITAGTLDAARIATGSLDAKIANLDAAVIGTGYINAARINTASIANATISTAQIANATIGAVQVTGTLTAAQINGTNLAVVNGSFSGTINVNNGTTNRLVITNDKIEVWADNGYGVSVRRVVLGNLA